MPLYFHNNINRGKNHQENVLCKQSLEMSYGICGVSLSPYVSVVLLDLFASYIKVNIKSSQLCHPSVPFILALEKQIYQPHFD